jgi:glucuronate isomerase
MEHDQGILPAERFFDPDPSQRRIALTLYNTVADLPIVSPHGHVDPRLFANSDYHFDSPTELLLIPDHYIFRMLYSQGISMADLGIQGQGLDVEKDHRRAWQLLAENFYLFRGTPTGIWIRDELYNVFGIRQPLNEKTAQAMYDEINDHLKSAAFRPRQLFEQFKIEVLCTTDTASDPLIYHKAIRESGWQGKILPTFRPDGVTNLSNPIWKAEIEALEQTSGITINGFRSFIAALEKQRAFFKEMGATATDHAVLTADTAVLSPSEVESIFQHALAGKTTTEQSIRFNSHMLMEMARMSVEDGLVMQIHVGSFRDHNPWIYSRYGANMGADIPIATSFTREMKPLLDQYGNNPCFSLILFNLDETTYARELAPLAGHYPAVKLGPPWWFHDSLNGMRRYFDQVMETAGIYNTAGFNDDTRAFPSIPARHDLWRRASANWLAGMVVRHLVSETEAQEMAYDLAYRLAKKAYNL